MHTATRKAWIRVSQKNPCPVCGHPDWCTVSPDGVASRCMRCESDRESVGSDGSVGWIHKLSEPIAVDSKAASKVQRMSQQEVEALAKRFYEHSRAADIREDLAESLGVSAESLDALRVGYGCDYSGREFASFPSRNAAGKVIGIVRRFGLHGEKKTYPGTRNGLFYCLGWSRNPGPVLIVEGGSDVAAGLTAGLCVIGRPSNIGGDQMIRQMVDARCQGRTVLVIGERDEKPDNRGKLTSCTAECGGCNHCWPGLHGAKEMARRLGCEWVMPPNGAKDLRECVSSGRLWPELLKLWPKRKESIGD